MRGGGACAHCSSLPAVVVALGAHATYACYVWDGAYVASSYTEIVPKGEGTSRSKAVICLFGLIAASN